MNEESPLYLRKILNSMLSGTAPPLPASYGTTRVARIAPDIATLSTQAGQGEALINPWSQGLQIPS